MLPTLQIGDRIVVVKFGYTIHRGDIIVVQAAAGRHGHDRRRSRQAGHRPAGRDDLLVGNTVLINGKPLSEPWLPPLSASAPKRPRTSPRR